MRSRWDDTDDAAAVERWAAARGIELARCVYASRLIGADPTLVLHGGGNTSAKQSIKSVFGDDILAVFVKASRTDLGTMEPEGFTALQLAPLARWRDVARRWRCGGGVSALRWARARSGECRRLKSYGYSRSAAGAGL